MTEEVPYREVHDLLEQHGWVLQRTTGSGDELWRAFVSTIPGRPDISFPVFRKQVLRAHFEKIKRTIEQASRGETADD
jgi:predicted RNA binding protein YcfA (HicA-like mRNA interferase family)